MIRTRRPKAVPKILRTKGRQLRDKHIAQHSSGDLSFAFDRDVYGHAAVKAALRTAQHDKCGFCESKVSHIASGDVEHFRPKAAVRARSNAPLVKPGYYWLAYEWTNLLFACELCNRRHKASLFPLIDETARARSHADDMSLEAPLFIDPTAEDPAAHIGFRQEYPYAVNGSVRGRATISALGLDRAPLVEIRRDRLEKVRLLRLSAQALRRKRDQTAKDLVQQIEIELQNATTDQAEFAAAVRSMLAAPLRAPRAARKRSTRSKPRRSPKRSAS
jgi:uncharacterized protein (TIGR02646 family)